MQLFPHLLFITMRPTPFLHHSGVIHGAINLRFNLEQYVLLLSIS